MKTVLQLKNMLSAAKRGLGIANKLIDPILRKTNKGRVMGNMNRLRVALRRAIQLGKQTIDNITRSLDCKQTISDMGTEDLITALVISQWASTGRIA